MLAYDGSSFRPPAPVALVSCRLPTSQKVIDQIPVLLDSGADVSLLPSKSLASALSSFDTFPRYELAGFDGTKSFAPAVELQLMFLDKKFSGQFLLIDEDIGILGRNVLNAVRILLDGPALSWGEWRPESTQRGKP
jgi:hypothetical protein